MRFQFFFQLGVVTLLLLSGCATPEAIYRDGRPRAQKTMRANDYGVVLTHGTGPDSCDTYGARDAYVFEADGTYYMHYDGAGRKGWLSCLATSHDLKNWEKHGVILDLGEPGEDDSQSASFGVTFFDGKTWHMFYLGTGNASPPPDRVPMPPYLTMKASSLSPAGPWIKQKGVIPFRPESGTYYSEVASPGCVVEHLGDYLQFFSASIRDSVFRRTIGIARTKDLNTPFKVDTKPILPLTEQIENSSLYFQEETQTWYLFTDHVGIDEDEYTDAIWVYWTDDLSRWDPEAKAVVLDGKSCLWSKRVIGLPAILKVGSKLALYYDGLATDGTGHMGRDVGLAWLDLPLPVPKTARELPMKRESDSP